jgi:thymidylate synthase (FAD)
MKIIKQSWQFEHEFDSEAIIKSIEKIARTCYKSEEYITDDSANTLVRQLIKNGHEAMLEHESITVRIITDRGVTHELVRHRLASYAQESTRYCNYSKNKFGNEVTFILPVWFNWYNPDVPSNATQSQIDEFAEWKDACMYCERAYFNLLKLGQTPQEARAVLPNSLKTEIVVTANLREWRHLFRLRCSPKAHPQMKELARHMLECFKVYIPVVFEDISYEI